MNKAELIEYVAVKANLSKADAERAINATLSAIKDTLKVGKSLVLVGFGTFKVVNRAARMGRNPRTGEKLPIPAAKVVTFRAGKTLKDEMNS